MIPFDPQDLRLMEALLFASAQPLSESALAERFPPQTDVAGMLEELRREYENRGIQLVRRGEGWAFRTAPDLGGQLRMQTTETRKLSRAALETLSIIAYHQPVTRAEIEEVRGVSMSKGTMDALLEAGWIHPKGRRRTPGRPMTWVTTDAFLDHFGLESLDELPGIEELKAAGLLDVRPAAMAYANRADDLLPEESEGEEPDDEAEDE